jgi:hypothetical protein
VATSSATAAKAAKEGNEQTRGYADWPTPEINVDARAATVKLVRKLPDGAGTITMGARNLRTSLSGAGTQALVMIAHNGEMLDYSIINVLKSEDRTKLGNKAHKRLGGVLRAIYPDFVLHRDLDLFGMRVDRADEDMYEVESVEGSEWTTQFRLEPYIAKGAGTILFAKPGSTKSYIALLMAVSIDAGCSTIWPSTRANVLFINLERSRESMAGRLYRVNKALGLPSNRPLTMINARGKTLAQVAFAASRAIQRKNVEVVFLDSISRSGGDLNDNKDANAVMDVLNGFGGGWLAIGHPPRGDSNRTFGSQMFDAAADLTVQVLNQRVGQTVGVGLKMVKFNDIPPRPTELLALDFDEGGLTSLRRARPAEFLEIDTGNTKSDLATVIAGVLPASGGGMTTNEVFTAVNEEGADTTAGAVRATLYARKNDLFRSWKERNGTASITKWGLAERAG